MVQFILKASGRTEVDLRKYTRCIYNMQMTCLRFPELLNYNAGSKWVSRQLGTFRQHVNSSARARTEQKKHRSSYHRLSEYVQGALGGPLHLDKLIRVLIRHTNNEAVGSIRFRVLHV